MFLSLAFLLYGNTIGHEYALDDQIVVTQNQFTREGLKGILPILTHDSFVGFYGVHKGVVQGGRYRPLSIVTFAIEQQFFGGNPHVSHAVNVILYGLTAWLLYAVLRRLLPRPPDSEASIDVPWIATLLFLVHPIHTEVVANIKGRDEILALLCALGSWMLQLRFVEKRKPAWLIGSGVLFFLAVLSKESALPFLALFPLALWFFTPATRKDQLQLAVPSLVAGVAYAALRYMVTSAPAVATLPEILNDPFLHATLSQRLATISDALLRYLRLLVVPFPLTHDYFFDQVPIVGWTDPGALASLGIHLALIGVALRGARVKDPIAFGILTYFLALSVVSNLVITVGVIMSERFLFIPSVGIAIAAAAGLERLAGRSTERRRAWLMRAVAGLLLVFGVLTVLRNPAWHDNVTLFERDVKTSSNSAKLQTSLGGTLIDLGSRSADPVESRRLREEGIAHLRKAVAIYPGYGQPWLLLGNVYAADSSKSSLAIDCYRRAISGWPEFVPAYINLTVMLRQERDFAGAAKAVRTVLARDSTNAHAWYELGWTFEGWGKPDSALEAYEKAVRADANYTAALARLGRAYGTYRGDWNNAANRLSEAIQKGETSEWVFANLAAALGRLGRHAEAIQVLGEGLRYHPESQILEKGLADTYHLMGDEPRAREHEAKASLSPGAGS